MKKMKHVLVGGIALTLLFSPGLSSVDAKGHSKGKSHKKIVLVDKNRNKIADKWEKQYKLSGKHVASKDNDRDGLSNLIEYHLKLNPLKSDTDKDGVKDGLEDTDKDELPNSTEIELGTLPQDADTDNDRVKDGDEETKDGVEYADLIHDLKLSIKSKDLILEVKYKYNKRHAHLHIKTNDKDLSPAKVKEFVQDFEAFSGLSSKELTDKMTADFGIESDFAVKLELKYLNGDRFELKKHISVADEDAEETEETTPSKPVEEDGQKDDQDKDDESDDKDESEDEDEAADQEAV